MRPPLLVCAALVAYSASAQQAPREGPGLGVEISAEDLAPWAITVQPDGAGLPEGAGTAREGERVYAEKCLACHGERGAGGPNDRLAGGKESIATERPVRTVGSYWPYATTLFDYVRRAMPFTQPQSLSDEEVYAVTAYLLYINGIIGEDEAMNAETLPRVVMPNRDNFTFAWPDWEG